MKKYAALTVSIVRHTIYVEITAPIPGACIYYTLDGSVTTTLSSVYFN